MTGFGTDAAAAGGPADQATLRGLTRGRRVTHDLADDLLTHLPDLGDIGTQRELDCWVEQAADTLRAVSEAIEERLIAVGRAGHGDLPLAQPTGSSALAGHSPRGAATPTRGADRP